MKCPICRHGETEKGFATVILERHTTTLIFKQVPASICNNCGEEFINETISSELFKVAKQAVKMGVQLDVRNYINDAFNEVSQQSELMAA
jgi:YgiT-type zinc finger domain-containing protein